MRDYLIAGVDPGATKTAVVVGQITPERHLHILGAAQSPTQGMRRGGITDIDEVANSIAVTLDRVMHLTGQRIPSAYFSITGAHLESSNHRGAVAITPTERDIAMADVQHVVEVAGAIPLEANRMILVVAPRTFMVDGQDGIKNPTGMSGYRLEVDAHIVTGSTAAYRNLVKCAERAHIAAEDVIVAPLASAQAVLSPSEREQGVVLIDLGGGTADVAIFVNGEAWRTFMMPLGGSLITDDIAYALRLPAPIAEEIKLHYGVATPARIPPEELIDLSQFLPNCQQVVPRRALANLIFPRVEEMLTLIRDEVHRSGHQHALATGVVLTGGTASLPGIVEIAAQVFDAPVRVGTPHSLYGVTDMVLNPAFATAIGLLRWHEQNLYQQFDQGSPGGLQAVMDTMRRWFQRNG